MVIPGQNSASTGGDLAGLGVFASLLVARDLIPGVRGREHTLSLRVILLRFGLSTVAYFGIIASGWLFSAGDYGSGLNLLVAVTIVVLVVSLRNTWDVLVSVGIATMATSN